MAHGLGASIAHTLHLIRAQERDAAAELFASVEGIALQKSVSKARTFNIGEVVERKQEEERVLQPEERAAFEVRRLRGAGCSLPLRVFARRVCARLLGAVLCIW